MRSFPDLLKAAFPDNCVGHNWSTQRWVDGGYSQPCMCGHPEADHPGGWESCDHTDGSCLRYELENHCGLDDEYCGGFAPQPGCRRPGRWVTGEPKLFAFLR